ncbi:hypothetical protein O181_032609 [Austropuccinia psidii MF-1]|uniref:Uncharacterized protein n=1 Tax=Austropuccinia psidii MF-1 TaxID=1389203 RepID=A0A9Q3H7P7_9BASI|nr:hypothetical protein [Austropuccinia psidii MF-1]
MEYTSTPIVVTASKKRKILTPKLSAASILMDESMAVADSDDSAKEEEAMGEPRPPLPKMTIPLAWRKLFQNSSAMVWLRAKASWGKNMQVPSSGGKGPENLMILVRAFGVKASSIPRDEDALLRAFFHCGIKLHDIQFQNGSHTYGSKWIVHLNA